MAHVKTSEADPRNALAHPLFWAAIALLLVNDHILKQAHVLPGAITGKLSDFAGMLVAPVLVAALFRLRGRVGRMVAFACVTGVFTALKLSRVLAEALEAVTAYTPLPWRLWCDPTDLVALSVLPLAWWLATREGKPASGARLRLIPSLRAAGFVLGVFACAATSADTEMYIGTAFLFNGTLRAHALRVYRLQASLDCTRTLDAPDVWPGPDAFVLQSCPTLASGDILPLDQGWQDLGRFSGLNGDFYVSPYYDAGIIGPICDAVLLQAEGLRPVVVTWNGVSAIEFSGADRFGDEANDDHGLVLERAGERLFIKGTSLLRVLPAGFEPAPADCPNGER
jgi:hypothetical protein